jgi:hypothetical protein
LLYLFRRAAPYSCEQVVGRIGGTAAFWIAADAQTLLALLMLIELDGALVSFGGFSGIEGSQVTAAPGFRVFLAGVEPILAGFHLSDHS